jgi:site-specific DNA-cytosine methylase
MLGDGDGVCGMKLMVDLFSGLGGASEAFIGADGWEVQRFENNPDLGWVLNTHTQDVQELVCPYHLPSGVDLIWASPPCRDFSRAFSAPGPVALREGRDFEPDMTLVKAAKRIIDELQPKYWVIENVRGAIPHFEELLGKPRQIIHDRWILWGNFPLLCVDPDWNVRRWHKQQVWGTEELAMNKRSLIPIEISDAMLAAVNNQTVLGDWV